MLRASARGPGKQLLDRTRGFVETGDFYSGFVSRDASGSRGFVLGTLWVRQMSRRHLERPETARQEPLQEFQELSPEVLEKLLEPSRSSSRELVESTI